MSSVATAPSTIPSSRPVPLLPIETSVSSSRSISSSSSATGVPRTSLLMAAVYGATYSVAARSPFSAVVRWKSSSR